MASKCVPKYNTRRRKYRRRVSLWRGSGCPLRMRPAYWQFVVCQFVKVATLAAACRSVP